MGGQDGFQRDMLHQSTESTTIVAGIRITPSKKFNLGVNVSQTDSEQALDPYDLPAPDYVETHPTMSFDLTNSHLYSMIDVSRLDLNADANFKFSNAFWLNVYYRYSDFEDNVTLFGDMNGNISILGAYLGWAF